MNRHFTPGVVPRQAWNHNDHYHDVILREIPDDCARGLDIGCGEGLLSRKLRSNVSHVIGIDVDAASIDSARTHNSVDGIEYVLADFLEYKLERESFDVIVSVSAIHHMDLVSTLERMKLLLRRGGRLAIVGCARTADPFDSLVDLGAKIAHRLHKLSRNYQQSSAPQHSPKETYGEIRRVAGTILPGVRYKRHLLWRYSLVWTKTQPT